MCTNIRSWTPRQQLIKYAVEPFQGKTGNGFFLPVLVLSLCLALGRELGGAGVGGIASSTVYVSTSIKNCFFVRLWLSWIQAPMAFRASCFGSLSLRWESSKLRRSMCGPNSSLLREKLAFGLPSWLYGTVQGVGFITRVCLILSYPFCYGYFLIWLMSGS